jgi:hypothetical protein
MAEQREKVLKFRFAGSRIDQAGLVVVVGTVEAAAAVPVPPEDGAVGVERGAALELVGVPVVEAASLLVVSVLEGEVPPVMTDPVLGMGVVIRVSVAVTAADEGDVVVELLPEDIFVMENDGLVLPESPNKTMR